jgi:glycosyltransferase involved in cell wall biosynthesis
MYTAELKRGDEIIHIEYEDEKEYVQYLMDGWTQEGISLPDKLKAREIYKRNNEIKPEEYDIDIYAPSPYHSKGTGFGNAYHATQKYLLKNHRVFLNPEFNGQKIGWYFIQPHILDQFPATEYRVLYTMFESTKPPVEWRKPLKEVDMVMVPSRWVKSVFDDYYNLDCWVWGHGIDSTTIPYVKRDRRGLAKDAKFVILHYNAQYRKGFDVLMKAFHLAFPDNNNVRLVLKGANLLDLQVKDPRIKLYSGQFSQKKMNELLEIADVFAFPSRGEGYGMPPLEAMKSGLPVIMPRQHGLIDSFDDNYCLDVMTRPSKAVYSQWEDDMGYFTESSVHDLAEVLQDAHYRWLNNHKPFREFSGAKCSRRIMEEFSSEVKVVELYDIIKEIIEVNGY